MFTSTRYMRHFLFLVLLLGEVLFAASLKHKYPSYSYVFSEFDVDESYIYDEDFVSFAAKNEKKIKKFYTRAFRRGKAVLPTMQGLLVDDGVSDLFIYLSMVESGFNEEAVSPKKAVGLWQFMAATAKHYDLSVCNTYDERCDTVSSTSAAIAYLNKLHKQFGKWYLAMLAYNCGEGRLQKAIQKAGSKELSILVDEEAKYLPKETRDYIKKILLSAMIGESELLEYVGLPSVSSESIVQVEVKAGTRLSDLAKYLKMEKKTLLKMNKQYKNGVLPKENKHYTVNIPEEKLLLFYMKYDVVEEPMKPKEIKPYFLSHIVQLGESLDLLAEKYHTDKEAIKRLNRLEYDALTVDSLLIIPVTKALFEKMLNDNDLKQM